MSITITVNTSPLAGTEGKKLTSTQIRDRLLQEAQNNVGITFSENNGNDSFVVSGRGELMLEILLTQMRREGFEMTVSRPRVLYKVSESGARTEPIEEVIIDVDDEYTSTVVDGMNQRKAEMQDMRSSGAGKTRLTFLAPSRGLIGYQNKFLTDTKGTGVINRLFNKYDNYKGSIVGRKYGALISTDTGSAAAYAIFNLQDRGTMFIGHQSKVYGGMVVGEQ
jgi:GTP-binding protein